MTSSLRGRGDFFVVYPTGGVEYLHNLNIFIYLSLFWDLFLWLYLPARAPFEPDLANNIVYCMLEK